MGGSTGGLPRLVPPPSRLQTAFEPLALGGAVACIAIAAWYWRQLPPTIATHFDLSGTPDGWGARAWFLSFALLGPIVYAALTLLARFPHRFNYPVPVTPANAEAQYRLARTFLSSIKATIVLTIAHLLWRTGEVGMGHATGIGWACGLLLVLVAGIAVGYVVAARRSGRNHAAPPGGSARRA